MKKETRIDYFPDSFIDESNDPMTEKFIKTDEGYLKGRAVVTNVGVFTYKMIDGSVRRELRLPEEVFNEDSMKSLSMIPLTNMHPINAVDTSNIKKLQVGNVGDDVRQDWYHLSAPLVVTDTETIKAIEEGKKGISCGYTVDIEDKAGIWLGVPYDVIQRNIRYNHIAVGIEHPRAGDAAVLKFDAYHIEGIREDKNLKKEVNTMLKKITIDGVEYEAEAKVIEDLHTTQSAIKQLKEDAETSKKDFQALEAERDSLKDECETLKKDAKELKNGQPLKVDEAVKARITLVETAKKADVEIKEDMSDIDVKKAVILKAFPKADEKLKDAEAVYIDARFDSAVEYLEERGDIKKENKEDISDFSKSETPEINADESRKKMIDRMKEEK